MKRYRSVFRDTSWCLRWHEAADRFAYRAALHLDNYAADRKCRKALKLAIRYARLAVRAHERGSEAFYRDHPEVFVAEVSSANP